MCGLKRALLGTSVGTVPSQVPSGLISDGEQGQEGSATYVFQVEQYMPHFLSLFFRSEDY